MWKERDKSIADEFPISYVYIANIWSHHTPIGTLDLPTPTPPPPSHPPTLGRKTITIDINHIWGGQPNEKRL